MSRLWKWPLAGLLALFVIGYLRALASVFPAWVLLVGGLLFALVVWRRLRRTHGGPAGLRREASADV